MAFFVLQAAAARTGIISAGLVNHLRDFAIFYEVHNVSRRPALPKFMGHEPHGPVYVSEELHIARTEIIQPWLAVWRLDKPILGAFAVAGESDLALAAIYGQAVELISAELSLLSGCSQLGHVFLVDVSEKVFGLDKVIA